MSWLKIFLFTGLFVNFVDSSDILFLLPIGSKSHKNVFDPIMFALAEEGHTITLMSMTKTPNLPPNIKEFVPLEGWDFNVNFGDTFEHRRLGNYRALFKWDPSFTFRSCAEILKNTEFDRIFAQKFDVIIMNGFLNNCLDGHVHVNGAPFIFITAMAPPFYVSERIGNHFPTSFIPFVMFDLSDDMNFWGRVINTGLSSLLRIIWKFSTMGKMEKMYRDKFGDHLPGIEEIEKNVSLILSNSHPLMTYPRPTMPNLIEIGGAHVVGKKAKPLPKDLEDFVGGSSEGFIYFSLGSIVQSKNMPEEIRMIFLKVFGKLKQRVLWKWESESMDGLPPNVKLIKWAPQQDLLGHKNIKLFITHGGLLSLQETTYFGVPILGFPIFIDQDMNLRRSEKWGYGISQQILELTEEKLETAINELINDPKYRDNAKRFSEIFRDQTETPLERALYWINYVIKHKGAPQLKSPAVDLTLIQYHSLDVIAFLLGSLILVIWTIKFILCRICRLFTARKAKKD